MTTQKCTPLLNLKEIASIFQEGFLYEMESFFVIDKETLSYDVNRKNPSFIKEATYIRKSFLAGKTIIVKNLESYNPSIRKKCAELGRDVDVHMYLVNENGKDSFPFHTDDRNVLIHVLYGRKDFYLHPTSSSAPSPPSAPSDKETLVSLSRGDELFIPKGQPHKAVPKGRSCLLSFGTKVEIDYDIPGGINQTDLAGEKTAP